MKLNTLLKEFTVLFAVIFLAQVEKIQTKKSCKLKKDVYGTYLLSCNGQFDSKERTITRKDKGSKKVRKGPQGPPGPDGPPGKDGVEGRQGPEGPMGPIGPTGVPGPRGHTGKPGPKGTTGDSGPMGSQGKPGIPGNCLQDPPKYSPELKKHYHCLPGPEGPQGIKGNRGPPGFPGVPGQSGGQGEKGDEGSRGRRGPVGMPGLPGNAGTVTCDNHYTEWISRYSRIEGNSIDGFFCPERQFLQGFKREQEEMKERYKFICCKIA